MPTPVVDPIVITPRIIYPAPRTTKISVIQRAKRHVSYFPALPVSWLGILRPCVNVYLQFAYGGYYPGFETYAAPEVYEPIVSYLPDTFCGRLLITSFRLLRATERSPSSRPMIRVDMRELCGN